MKKINHLWTKQIHESGYFANITSYDDLVSACNQFAENNDYDPETQDVLWEETRKERVGAAFEVYTEFFLTRYGATPLANIIEVRHTSDEKYHVGDDFEAKDLSGNTKLIQVKFRNRINEKFTRSDLGTFVSKCDEEDVPSSHRVLFTNLEHRVTADSPGVFHHSWNGGIKQIKQVFDRLLQESFIERDPAFWHEFAIALIHSSARPKTGKAPVLRSHQIDMLNAIRLNMNATRVDT